MRTRAGSLLGVVPLVVMAAALAVTMLAAAAPAMAAPRSPHHRTVFWVSPTGDDSGPGTRAEPFATLDRARDAVRGLPDAWRRTHDIAVKLRDGTYRLDHPFVLRPQDSGLGGHDVVYRAPFGKHPVISGAMQVPSQAWQPYAGGIMQARVGQVASRQLYVNGVRATVAQTDPYPEGFLPHWTSNGVNSGIEFANVGPDPAKWTNIQDIRAVIQTQWKMMSVPLDSLAAPYGGPESPGLLTVQQPAWDNANVFRDPDTNQPGLWSFWQVTRFENALQFLDQPGEFYLDEQAGILYYYPRLSDDLSSADVELPLQQTLIDGRGRAAHPVSDIRFEGLTFSGATWLEPSGSSGYVSDQSGFHLVGPDHQANVIGHDPNDSPTPGNVRFRYAHDLTFSGDTFEHLGAAGLKLGAGSQGNRVTGNLFTDISSSALELGGISSINAHPRRPEQVPANNTISNNVVSNVAVEFIDAAGIFVGFTRHTIIAHNTIHGVPWSGIAMGWGWGLLDPGSYLGLPGATKNEWGKFRTPTPNRDSVIRNNTISHYLSVLWDGGAIYTTGQQGTSMRNGLVVKANVATGKVPTADGHTSGGNTFYTDGGSRYITVRGNVSIDNPVGTAYFGPPPPPGDPLPYPSWPSDGNVMPYGSDIGGCRTYGDIRYVGNHWMQDPFQQDMELYNTAYTLNPVFGFPAYSDEGFFNVCPYVDPQGVSHPTNLTYVGNQILPSSAGDMRRIVAKAGVRSRPSAIPADRWTVPEIPLGG